MFSFLSFAHKFFPNFRFPVILYHRHVNVTARQIVVEMITPCISNFGENSCGFFVAVFFCCCCRCCCFVFSLFFFFWSLVKSDFILSKFCTCQFAKMSYLRNLVTYMTCNLELTAINAFLNISLFSKIQGFIISATKNKAIAICIFHTKTIHQNGGCSHIITRWRKKQTTPLCYFLGLSKVNYTTNYFKMIENTLFFGGIDVIAIRYMQQKTLESWSSQFTSIHLGNSHFPRFFGAVIQCEIAWVYHSWGVVKSSPRIWIWNTILSGVY